MGFKDNWKKLVNWWANNALANQAKLSAGISWFLVVVISSLAIPLIATVQGEAANWGAFFVVLITSTVALIVMLVESVFGRGKIPDAIDLVTLPEPELASLPEPELI